ncbi:MAG TPA: endonuclease III [Bacteroidales bacterium]|nr:endonuclease III [Bacteroidales bacterium]
MNWSEHITPLINLYAKRKHPLDYQSRYQLLVMVILSAQDSDRHINSLAPALFEAYPSIAQLSKGTPEDLHRYINSVRNFDNKSKWLVKLAQMIGDDNNIPNTLDELTKLPGVGRKSANVIIRESGGKAEGIIVDLHVLRVAPRLGIAEGTKPEKIEKQLMETLPQDQWNEAGMAMSFLGRDICRPSNPKCKECIMNTVCNFYNSLVKPKLTT